MKKLPWRAMVRGPGSGRGVCAAAQTTIEQKLVAISTARMRCSFPKSWRVWRHLSCPGFRDPDSNPAFGHAGSDDIPWVIGALARGCLTARLRVDFNRLDNGLRRGNELGTGPVAP